MEYRLDIIPHSQRTTTNTDIVRMRTRCGHVRQNFSTHPFPPPQSPPAPFSNPPPRSHLPQALLVLQHQLLIANKLLLAAANTAKHAANAHATANTAAKSRESSEFPRMAFRFGAVRARQRSDDSARISRGDCVGWDILRVGKSATERFLTWNGMEWIDVPV
jgi:hypothetical protein